MKKLFVILLFGWSIIMSAVAAPIPPVALLGPTPSSCATGLPEQWLMHEGSGDTFADATCNDNTITASNITWGTGTGVTSPTFNGSTSTAVAAQTAITNFDGTQPFSVSVWVNLATIAVEQTFASTIQGPATNYQGWEFSIGGGGAIDLFVINNYPGNAIYVSSIGSLTTNETSNVIATYDGSQHAAGVGLYINGVYAGLGGGQIDTLTLSAASGLPLRVGTRGDGTVPLDGSISNLQVFSGVLSAGQIAAIQAAGP